MAFSISIEEEDGWESLGIQIFLLKILLNWFQIIKKTDEIRGYGSDWLF